MSSRCKVRCLRCGATQVCDAIDDPDVNYFEPEPDDDAWEGGEVAIDPCEHDDIEVVDTWAPEPPEVY